MRIIKRAISYLLAFLLGIAIILEVMLIFFNNNLLDENNMKIELEDTNYYFNIYSIIKNTATDYIMQSGFNEMIINDVITEKRVQSDITNIITCLYNNKKIEIQTDDLKESLHKNIQKQVGNQEIEDETKTNISEFEDSIIDEYKSNMYYSEDTINSIGKYLQKTSKLVSYLCIGLAIFIILLCIILFILNKPSIGVALIISGVICTFVKIYSGIRLAINNILILNWALSLTLTQIMNKIVNRVFVTGIVLTILGIIIIVFFEYDNSKKIFTNNKEKKE